VKPLGCECSDCAKCNGTVDRLKQRVKELESALRNIVTHQGVSGGTMAEYSATCLIAKKALGD